MRVSFLKPKDVDLRAKFEELERKQRRTVIVALTAGGVLSIMAIAGFPPWILPYGGIAIVTLFAVAMLTCEIKKTILYWRDMRDR